MKLDYFLIFTTLIILICLYHLSRKEKYENISFTLKSRPGIKDLTVGELKLSVPDGVVLVPRNGSAGMMQVQEPAAMGKPAMEGVSKAGIPQTGTAQDQVNAIMAQMGDEPITPETLLNMTKPFDGEADVMEKELASTPDPECSVTLYQHGNYGGSSYTTSSSIPRMGPIKFEGTQTSINDQVSSAKLSPGCQSVTLYQHGNYGGSSYTTSSSIPRMGPIKFEGTQTSMNDQVSSMKIN